MIGRIITALLRDKNPDLATTVQTRPGTSSSYSVLMSPGNSDRIVFHCAGANELFNVDDVDYQTAGAAKVFHLGYPPLLPALLEEDGTPLATIFRNVKETGDTVTSLDMAMPDPSGFSGNVDWRAILANTLPYVDVFVPSIEEIMFMLRREAYEHTAGHVLPSLTREVVEDLAEELLSMGSAVVGFKLSHLGLYLQSSAAHSHLGRLSHLGLDLSAWQDQQVYRPAFSVDVVGTTGAGDAAYAAILAGLLHGLPPEDIVTMANTVAAHNIQAADATSAIRPWEETFAQVNSGWRQKDQVLPGF